jgi:glycosyltransferase involved in cell wall biosynthesis
LSPQVSVIVPTYRRAQLLELTLESVRAQSFEAWECLVCEDGDDPATAELLHGLSARDPRFRHLTLPHSGRPGRTRNAGRLLGRRRPLAPAQTARAG